MIKVLLFAELGEVAGQREIAVDVEEATISDIIQILSEQFSQLNLGHVMVALNEEYAEPNAKVESGDIVAFIPPVSGG